MPDKIYVPKSNAKAVQTKYGEIIKLSFHVDSLLAFVKENVSSKGWINIDVLPRKEKGKYGETHYMILNEWSPDGNGSALPRQQQPRHDERSQSNSEFMDPPAGIKENIMNLPTDTSGDDFIPF